MSKLFSPSLDMREEPPNSKAVVVNVTGKHAMVRFRGKQYTARMADLDIVVGEAVAFIEHPRNSYWIKRNGPSWYANPLENWISKGHKAQATLEYFLRNNPKWTPYVIREGADGEPELLENPAIIKDNPLGDLSDWDTDGDGKISSAEWAEHGGNADMFNEFDKNGDGFIDQDEWDQRTNKGASKKTRIYQWMNPGTMPPTPPDEWTEIPPFDLPPQFNAADYINSWYGLFEQNIGGSAATDYFYVQKNPGLNTSQKLPAEALAYPYMESHYAGGMADLLPVVRYLTDDGVSRVQSFVFGNRLAPLTKFYYLYAEGSGGSAHLPPDSDQEAVDFYNLSKSQLLASCSANNLDLNSKNITFKLVQNGSTPVIAHLSFYTDSAEGAAPIGGTAFSAVSCATIRRE